MRHTFVYRTMAVGRMPLPRYMGWGVMVLQRVSFGYSPSAHPSFKEPRVGKATIPKWAADERKRTRVIGGSCANLDYFANGKMTCRS